MKLSSHETIVGVLSIAIIGLLLVELTDQRSQRAENNYDKGYTAAMYVMDTVGSCTKRRTPDVN